MNTPERQITLETTDPDETATLARELAARLVPDTVVCLTGDLGAGKSVFARALGAELGVDDPMPSPTFTLINEYRGNNGIPILHIDLYRISGEDEFQLLGLDELMKNAITLVEWPERAPELLRSATVTVTITIAHGDDRRTITIDWDDAHSRY